MAFYEGWTQEGGKFALGGVYIALGMGAAISSGLAEERIPWE
jgi:hypothetical protein